MRVTPVEGYNYIRSDAVLSPSNAQEPPPVSREATQAAMAREAYYKSMQPAQYGVHMHNIKDLTPQQQASKYNNYNKVHKSFLFISWFHLLLSCHSPQHYCIHTYNKHLLF